MRIIRDCGWSHIDGNYADEVNDDNGKGENDVDDSNANYFDVNNGIINDIR